MLQREAIILWGICSQADLPAGKGERWGPSYCIPRAFANAHPLLTMRRRASRLPW